MYVFFPLVCFVLLFSVSAQAEQKTVTYIHADAQGSPVLGTDQDGNIVFSSEYQPYGVHQDQGPSSSDLGYTGHYEQADIGLVYAGARWYDPEVGRFLSTDSVGFSVGNPASFNRYKYGNNNPYRFVDPDGNFEVQASNTLHGVGYNILPASGALEKGVRQALKKSGSAAKKSMKAIDSAGKIANMIVGKPASWSNDSGLQGMMLKFNEADVDRMAIKGYAESDDGFDVVSRMLTKKELTNFIKWSREHVDGFSDYGYEGIGERAKSNLEKADSRINKYVPGAGIMKKRMDKMKEYQ